MHAAAAGFSPDCDIVRMCPINGWKKETICTIGDCHITDDGIIDLCKVNAAEGIGNGDIAHREICLLYTSPSPRD